MVALLNAPRASWNRQPQWPVVARSALNPELLISFNSGVVPFHYEKCLNLNWNFSSSAKLAVYRDAKYFDLVNLAEAAELGSKGDFDYMLGSNSAFWVVCHFLYRSFVNQGSSLNHIFSTSSGDITAKGIGAFVRSGTSLEVYLGTQTFVLPMISAGAHTLVYGRSNGGLVWAWVDGQLVYSTTGSTGTAVGGVTKGLSICCDSSVTNRGLNGGVALLSIGIGSPELFGRYLSINPWKLFDPSITRVYLIPSSGGATYNLTSSVASASLTPSASVSILRALQAALSSDSSTSTITINTATLISLLSAVVSASSTSTGAISIQRVISTVLASASSTSSSAVNIQRALSTTVASASSVASVTLSIAGLIALLSAISSTSSTATASASIQRALLSTLTSGSSTDSVTLNTTTLIALLSAITSGSLTATSALNIARSLSTAINSDSSSSSIVFHVQRSLVTSHNSQSSTSISALELINLIALASAINSQSSTATATVNLARALVSNLLSASNTADISVPVLRELASTLVSASLSDNIDLSLAVSGQIDLVSSIQSTSLTNSHVRLLADLVAAIQTEMKLQMVGVAPSLTMTGSGPSIAVHRT